MLDHTQQELRLAIRSPECILGWYSPQDNWARSNIESCRAQADKGIDGNFPEFADQRKVLPKSLWQKASAHHPPSYKINMAMFPWSWEDHPLVWKVVLPEHTSQQHADDIW